MGKLNAFLLSDLAAPGKRRNILSTLPLYTIDPDYLGNLLQKRKLPKKDQTAILSFAQSQRDMAEQILNHDVIEDEIPLLSEADFRLPPFSLPLSGMFYPKDIRYHYEEYLEHKKTNRTVCPFACKLYLTYFTCKCVPESADHPARRQMGNDLQRKCPGDPFRDPPSEAAQCDRTLCAAGSRDRKIKIDRVFKARSIFIF